jgi:2-polyprenyl-3-methyl-5-hydroxy-6-metoxy-1,4-benzoquinol methylase
MTKLLKYTLVEGIKCYSPKESNRYVDYPTVGFDLTEKLEKYSFWVRSRIRLLKSIVDKYSRRFNKARFLEIGCGTGTFLQAIETNKNLSVTGSEIYIKGLLYAKKRASKVEFIQYDVKHGILDQTFDIIGAFDVIEHIDDDMTAISNIFEMLNDGGYCVITVPQYMFLWSRLDEIVNHKRRYSRKELLTKFRKQGFQISYCSSFLFLLFPLMLFQRFFDRMESNFVKKEKHISEGEFETRVRLPKLLNWLFDNLMRFDEALIKCGTSLPVGGSLLLIAKKQKG